jgi:very-short-patch-repair endonuclease
MITGPKETLKRARKLRSEMSMPEALLWRELRSRPGGFKFRRQHPAGVHVLDFYCAAVRLAIEVDGIAHDSVDAARHDAARANFLRSQHVATLRVPAKALLEDIGAVVARIIEVCRERTEKMRVSEVGANAAVPLHHASHGPPPRSGEDLR